VYLFRSTARVDGQVCPPLLEFQRQVFRIERWVGGAGCPTALGTKVLCLRWMDGFKNNRQSGHYRTVHPWNEAIPKTGMPKTSIRPCTTSTN